MCRMALRKNTSMNITSESHLLINVHISSVGLNTYKLGKIRNYPKFRIDRFLTTCESLSKVNYKSVKIYYSLDEKFKNEGKKIKSLLYKIFPSSFPDINEYRNESISEWRDLSRAYCDDDIILFTTNDDHGFVAQDTKVYEEMVTYLKMNKIYELGLITHFPEMIGRLGRVKNMDNISSNLFSTTIDYVIGTALVKGNFFKNWWADTEWDKDPTQVIARPDNPFGRSVSIKKTNALVPKKEILRHLDGYSHVFAFKPLQPLRNTYFNLEKNHIWNYGYWPIRIKPDSLPSIDMHRVLIDKQDKFFRKCLTAIARLQACWAIRFYPENFKYIISTDEINNKLLRILVLLITSISLPVIRNIPDYLIEKIYISIYKLFNIIEIKIKKWPAEFTYFGLSRFFLIRLYDNKKRKIL
jgi:hypothetical protein